MKQPVTKFGHAIRRERLRKFWSQRDVARKTKLSPAATAEEPDPENVVRIAECFESDPSTWLRLALPKQFKVWEKAFRTKEKR